MHLKNLRIRGGLILGKENINIKYEHQNNSNYLVIEDNVEYDDYQYKMLRRNKPEHFLRFSMYSVNGRYGIYYDITSRQQLSKYYEYGKMTMEDVKNSRRLYVRYRSREDRTQVHIYGCWNKEAAVCVSYKG